MIERSPWTSWRGIGTVVFFALVAVGALAMAPAILLDEGANHGAIAFWGLLIGAGVTYAGWEAYKRAQLVRNTPTSKVRSMAVGLVEVKGEAHPVGEPLVSPLTGREACMYALEVEEHHPDDDGPDWETVLSLGDQVPFHVDDGTGRVRVEPGDATLEIGVEDRVRVDDGHEPPDALGEWAEARGMVESADAPDPEGIKGRIGDLVDSMTADSAEAHLVRTSRHDRRYEETVLAAGESAYVLGGAEPREEHASKRNERNLVVREHDGTGRFVVSDRSEDALVEDQLVGSVGGLILGAVLLTYGLGALVVWLGIV